MDNEKKLVETLKSIRDNKYQKKSQKKVEKEDGFASMVELLNYLFDKKTASIKNDPKK